MPLFPQSTAIPNFRNQISTGMNLNPSTTKQSGKVWILTLFLGCLTNAYNPDRGLYNIKLRRYP